MGKSLSTDVDRDFNTYMTSDGGLVWKKLMDGPHIVKVIEEIGLVILVDFNKPTNQVVLTFDFENFHKL